MQKFYDVIIIGSGPAGIFAALEFRRNNNLSIALFEKGADLEKRICYLQKDGGKCKNCNPCAIISGWGGAGAFSDGKLTLSSNVGGILDQYLSPEEMNKLIKYVDDIYLKFGAPDKLYGNKSEDDIDIIRRKAVLAQLKLIPAPIRHLGSGKTQEVLKNIREYLLERNVEIFYKQKVEQILTDGDKVSGVMTADGQQVYSKYVICSPGREGSEWLSRESSRLGIKTEINPVDIGVRVEIPAETFSHITDVIYEAKFIYYSKTFDDKVRTFCMNPNGEVVLENIDGLMTVNGHTHSKRKTNNTNFALLLSKTFTEPFKEPIAYGKYVARLANLLGDGVLIQRLGDLLAGRRSTDERIRKSIITPTLREATPGDLSLVFPYRHLTGIIEMLRALDVVAPGVYSNHTLLYGVEVKFYSSRLQLSSELETKVRNCFAVGDGAGVTRGLVQASISGIMASRYIMQREK